MHHLDLILTLTGGLTVALVFGYLTHLAGLSPIVGYLLAGIAVGPHTPGFVADQSLAEQLAEVGVILLMFGVGLQFHIDELLAVRRVAIPGALIQSLVATVLGALVARAFGWDWSAGVVFGLAISVASTVVLVRVLAENRDLHTPAGHIAVGWLVIEDLLTVVVLVILPALFSPDAPDGHVPMVLGIAVFKVATLVAFAFVIGGRAIPWLLSRVALTRSRELFTLTVLVVALGLAVGSAKVFGVSMALGAFLAGMVVGRSEFSLRAASEALPMRDAFAVLFFVSVGLLFDPASIMESPGMLAATLTIILIGKPLSALAIVLLLGYPARVALGVAVALAQIGEFSFILASLGKQLGVLPSIANDTLIAAAIVSISINPLLYRTVDPLAKWLSTRPFLARWFRARAHLRRVSGISVEKVEELSSRHRAVVVGYGPVERTVARLLQENDVEPTIIELNLEVVQSLRLRGIDAFYGDAAHRETLKAAGLARADTFILSSSGLVGSEEIIRMAREINPEVRVLARAVYVSELRKLLAAGADEVFSGEGEIALGFTVAVLRELGATPEQIDREQERVRTELFGGEPSAEITPPATETDDEATAASEPETCDSESGAGKPGQPNSAAEDPSSKNPQ
jgi:CPA2 family monovalent cation:H+ antiporter-2